MKRVVAMVLCLIFTAALCGCKKKDAEIQVPVNYYYCKNEYSYNSDSGIFCVEIHEGVDFRANTKRMLDSYLLGPYIDGCINLLPENTRLVCCEMKDNALNLRFSEELSQLSGVRISMFCSCVTMTVADYTQIETVIFSAENSQLDNKDEIILNVADIAITDTVA